MKYVFGIETKEIYKFIDENGGDRTKGVKDIFETEAKEIYWFIEGKSGIIWLVRMRTENDGWMICLEIKTKQIYAFIEEKRWIIKLVGWNKRR